MEPGKKHHRKKHLLHHAAQHATQAGIQPRVVLADVANLHLLPLNERLQKVMELHSKAQNIKPTQVYFMVCYDIENNKIRNRIAKYLLKRGCERIQKSVYMALLDRNTMRTMQDTLTKIQAMYHNEDSIIFLPISTDSYDKMKLIGHNINFTATFENKSTLFF